MKVHTRRTGANPRKGKTHMKCQTRSWRRIALMAVGVLAAGAVAVPALASHTVKIDSTVTLPPPQKHPFSGEVESSNHACEVHRKVKVFRVQPGRDHVTDAGDATDWSNSRGKWRNRQYISPEGNYYAKVVRTERAAGTIVCRGDRSPTRHVQHQG
jgi:hypothetical protein